MPQLTIDGVAVTMTVAEFIEYQKLMHAEPEPKQPEPTPDPVVPQPVPTPPPVVERVRETRIRRSARDLTSVRRVELQRLGFKNVTKIQGAIALLAGVGVKLPGANPVAIETDSGLHKWLMAQDEETRVRYNAYASIVRKSFPDDGVKVWNTGLISGLIAIEMDYGHDVAWAALKALERDEATRQAIQDSNISVFTQLSPEEMNRTRLRLPFSSKARLYREGYSALLGGAERVERAERETP